MWIEVTTALIAGCCGGAATGLAIARVAMQRASAVASSPARGLSSLRSSVEEHAARLDELETILRRIDNRTRMQRIRKNAEADDAVPDPRADPSGWKAYMRARRPPNAGVS